MTVDDLVRLYEEHRNCQKLDPKAHAMRVVIRALRDEMSGNWIDCSCCDQNAKLFNEILGDAGEKVAGEVERLTTEGNISEWAAVNERVAHIETRHRAEAAEAEVERLKGVLGIFAAIKADDGDTFDTWKDDVIIRCEVTVGDLKKARAALEVSR